MIHVLKCNLILMAVRICLHFSMSVNIFKFSPTNLLRFLCEVFVDRSANTWSLVSVPFYRKLT